MDWATKLAESAAEHEARSAREHTPGERPDFHLAAIAGASWAAGLAALMLGHREAAALWLRRAAEEYRTSGDAAPAGSWGRPIAALRCRLLAGDVGGAQADARWALESGALEAEGSVAAYCACLALLALGRHGEALEVARVLRSDGGFSPAAVAEALVAIAELDGDGYREAAGRVLASFEPRDAFLEDVAVADTVLVLEELAQGRGLPAAALRSPLLPAP